MMITIGTTTSDRRSLNKTFTGVAITVQLKQPCDILNPVFILAYNSNFVSANYLHCAELNRYYFINNINLMPGHQMELACSVDVLMSYNASIKNISCVVSRQETAGLSMIPDSNILLQNFSTIDVLNFPNQFDAGFGSYVLQVLGG